MNSDASLGMKPEEGEDSPSLPSMPSLQLSVSLDYLRVTRKWFSLAPHPSGRARNLSILPKV